MIGEIRKSVTFEARCADCGVVSPKPRETYASAELDLSLHRDEKHSDD